MRLFFALWPSPAAAERLTAIANETAELLGGRPTRRETLHLTLAFLGEVADERLACLLEAVSGLRPATFNVRVDQLGFWRRNRLIWAGCRDASAPLEALVAALRDRLDKVGFAVSNGDRPFTPHVTLVRKTPDIAQNERVQEIQGVEWHCAEYVLVRSQLSPDGPSYEPLARFALTGER